MDNSVSKKFKFIVFSVTVFCFVHAIAGIYPEGEIIDIVEKKIEKISKMPADKQKDEYTILSDELKLCLATSIGSRISGYPNISNNDSVMVGSIYTIFAGDMYFLDKIIMSGKDKNAKDIFTRRINSQVMLYPISNPVILSEKVLMTIALAQPYILLQKTTVELCRKKIIGAKNLKDFLPFLVVLYINGDKDILKNYENDENTKFLLQSFNARARIETKQIKKENPELYKELSEQGNISIFDIPEVPDTVPRRRIGEQ